MVISRKNELKNVSISLTRQQLIDALIHVLKKDDRVSFAYLYGSFVSEGGGHDVDVAVYPKSQADDTSLPIDLKIELHQKTDISPEAFDVRNLAGILEKGDVFALLYLRNVLEKGLILVNKEKAIHEDFLERYGRKFRACEGLMHEVLT
jgi:predicted nucleotidyltransferase